MNLSHRRNLRNDNVRVFFKDVAYYNLKVLKPTDPGGAGSARFFLDGSKFHPLKNTEPQKYLTMYRWVKLNCVKCFFF